MRDAWIVVSFFNGRSWFQHRLLRIIGQVCNPREFVMLARCTVRFFCDSVHVPRDCAMSGTAAQSPALSGMTLRKVPHFDEKVCGKSVFDFLLLCQHVLFALPFGSARVFSSLHRIISTNTRLFSTVASVGLTHVARNTPIRIKEC